MSRIFTDIFPKKDRSPPDRENRQQKTNQQDLFSARSEWGRTDQFFEVRSMLSQTSYRQGSPEAKRLYSAIM